MRSCPRVLIAVFAAFIAMATGAARAQISGNTIGATHIGPVYYFGSQDCLNEGEAQIAAMNSHTIKVQMDASSLINTYSGGGKYPWNSSWPSGITTLVAEAQTQYFVNLFADTNFKTYVITSYCPSLSGTGSYGGPQAYWYQLYNDTSIFSHEQTQFTNLCNWLLSNPTSFTPTGGTEVSNPNGLFTGKTFVFENWEGDNAIASQAANLGQSGNVPSTAITGMINWFNCRAAGVKAARANYPSSSVTVLSACEANFVDAAMEEKGLTPTNNPKAWNGTNYGCYPYTVTDDVLPNTSVDIASYSAYDTMYYTSGNDSFANALNWIKLHCPSTVKNGTGSSAYSCMGVGEFGIPVGSGGKTENDCCATANNILNQVNTMGLKYAYYWEIYSNELNSGYNNPPYNGNNAAVEAFWMVKPDGTPDDIWHLWRWQCITTDSTRNTSAEVIQNLTKTYGSGFSTSGLGTGWTTANYSGDISFSYYSGYAEMKVAQNGSSNPYGLMTCALPSVTSTARGLEAGEYATYTCSRLQSLGTVGCQLWGTSVGSGNASGDQPLDVYNNGWVPISWTWNCPYGATNPTYDWDTGNPADPAITFGLRLDAIDGTFASVSYYINGTYSGAWLYYINNGNTTLDDISMMGQCNTNGDGFEFGNMTVYQN